MQCRRGPWLEGCEGPGMTWGLPRRRGQRKGSGAGSGSPALTPAERRVLRGGCRPGSSGLWGPVRTQHASPPRGAMPGAYLPPSVRPGAPPPTAGALWAGAVPTQGCRELRCVNVNRAGHLGGKTSSSVRRWPSHPASLMDGLCSSHTMLPVFPALAVPALHSSVCLVLSRILKFPLFSSVSCSGSIFGCLFNDSPGGW